MCYLVTSDDVKHKLVHMHHGRVFIKLVTLATLSSNTEVQYNSAGTLGQITLIGKYLVTPATLSSNTEVQYNTKQC